MGAKVIKLKPTYIQKDDIIEINKDFIHTKKESYCLYPDVFRKEILQELTGDVSNIVLWELPIDRKNYVMEISINTKYGIISYPSKYIQISGKFQSTILESDLKNIKTELFFDF